MLFAKVLMSKNCITGLGKAGFEMTRKLKKHYTGTKSMGLAITARQKQNLKAGY